jgi:hypothetical protein
VQIFDTAKPTRELKNYLRTAQQRPVCMPKVRGGNATLSTPEYLTPFRFLPGRPRCEYSGVPNPFSFPPRAAPVRSRVSSLPQGVFVRVRVRV